MLTSNPFLHRLGGVVLFLAGVAAFNPTSALEPLPEAPGRMVDIGGFRLHLSCVGEGSPTVVIDGGAGTWSTHYSHIQAELAGTTRVCTYDRAGLGWSDPGPKPRNSGRMVEELHKLLHDAGISPPVVLVGHSLGGYNVLIYQSRFPEEVAGLVLIDSAHPEQWSRLPVEVSRVVKGAPQFLRARAQMAREGKLTAAGVEPQVASALPQEIRATLVAALLTPKPYEGQADEMEAAFESATQVPAGLRLGDLPLVVLSAKNSYGDFAAMGIPVEASNRAWAEMQKDLTRLSTGSKQIISEGTHALNETDPAAMVSVIRLAAEKVRQRPLPLAALGLPPRTLPLTSTPETDALLRRLETAYASMNAEAFAELFTEDVKQLDVNRRVHIRGREAWKEQTRRVNAAHHRMERRHRGRARVGDWVVAEIEWSGVVRGESMGTPGHDRAYRYTGLGMLRIEKGRIREQVLYGDSASLTEQLRTGPAR